MGTKGSRKHGKQEPLYRERKHKLGTQWGPKEAGSGKARDRYTVSNSTVRDTMGTNRNNEGLHANSGMYSAEDARRSGRGTPRQPKTADGTATDRVTRGRPNPRSAQAVHEWMIAIESGHSGLMSRWARVSTEVRSRPREEASKRKPEAGKARGRYTGALGAKGAGSMGSGVSKVIGS